MHDRPGELVRARSAVVQEGGLLRDPPARVLRRQRRRLRRLPRARREARLPAVARRRLPVAAPVLPEPAPRRRLRHRRLLRHPSGLRQRRGLHLLRRPGAPARDARDRRPRHEPHVDRPSVVPGEPHRSDRAVRRLVRLGRRRHALERGAHHLHRHRAVELDVGPGARPVLLAPVLQPPARPELRQPRGAGADAERAALLARPRARRLPARRRAVPLRARRHERREPPGDARVPAAGPRRGRRALLGPRAARRGEPVAGRRRRSTSATATSATWRSTSR